MGRHGSIVFNNLESLLSHMLGGMEEKYREKYKRYWTRIWKIHKAKNPSEPWVCRCAICSGEAQKRDEKNGVWKVSTRNQQKALREQMNEEPE